MYECVEASSVIIAALGYPRAKENKLKKKEKQRMEKRPIIL